MMMINRHFVSIAIAFEIWLLRNYFLILLVSLALEIADVVSNSDCPWRAFWSLIVKRVIELQP